MEAPWLDWETAAQEILDSTNTSVPVDAFALAKACEFEVRAHAGRGEKHERRDGDIIYIDPRARRQRQHMEVSHELGHWGLDRHELPQSEYGAKYLGGALLLPRREMDRDLARTAWALLKLRDIHVNASLTAIAVRTTQLRDAVATILDPCGKKKPWRITSPWINDRHLRRISAWERELAQRAYEAGEEVRGDELCYALPLLDGPPHEHRVLVLCELEQLSLRL